MLIAFLIVAVLPVIGIFIVPICIGSPNSRQQKWGLLMLAFLLGILAFNFTPLSSENTDLLRHISRMNLAQVYSFGSNSATAFENLPLFYLVLKLFSFCNSPYCLPFWSTFIEYGIIFIIIYKHVQHYSGDRNSIIYGVISILCLTSFLGYCSGIFQYLTFVLYGLFVYLDLYTCKNKYKIIAWCGYFSLLFLHSSAVLLLLLRILFEICRRYKKLRVPIYVFCLLWSGLQNVAIQLLNSFSGVSQISYLISVISGYTQTPSVGNIHQTRLRIVALVIFGILSIVIRRRFRQYEDTISDEDGMYAEYLFLVVIFTVGAYFQYDIFIRFIMLTVFMGAPLIGLFFMSNGFSRRDNQFISLLFLGFCFLTLAFYYISTYTQFHFNALSDILFTNIISILRGMFG